MKKENPFIKFCGKYMSKIVFVILVGVAAYFYTVFKSFDMFPKEWGQWLLMGMAVVLLLVGLLTFLPKLSNMTKFLTMLLNILLAILVGIASWYLPSVRAKIEQAFVEVPLEGEAEINFYVLKDEYKLVDEEVDVDTTEEHTIHGYKDAMYIIQESVDLVNQDYAMLVCNRELLSDGVQTLPVASIFDAVDALYTGMGDVMVMNSSYIPMIEDITGYEDFSERVDVVYTVYKKLQIASEATAVDVTQKPFNVLILGNDKWGNDIRTTGRTDVNIIASINPVTKQVSFVTVPRDGYVPNACYYDREDKLTHAGVYGIRCTELTLEQYFGIEINYYVVINFSSLVKIVDAMGGVDVDNPYTFKANSIATYKGTFEKGLIHLDGKQALAYVRERKSLKNGDVGRGEHQALVIKSMINQLTEPAMITRIDKLLESISGTFKTNISMDEIYALAQMQLDDMAVWNINLYSLSGKGGYDYCPAMGMDRTYFVTYLYKNQVEYVKNVMNQVHNGETLEQGELPKN